MESTKGVTLYPSVLILDDDQDFRALLTTSLEAEGFRTVAVDTPQNVLEQIHLNKPLFLILELSLPDMAGDELCRMIKDDPLVRDVIIFVLTWKADLETRLTCFASGANEVLGKPVEIRELVARMHRFIRMIDEFKSVPAIPIPSPREIDAPRFREQEKTQGAVDALTPKSETFARVRPRYGVYRIENLIGSGGMGHVFKAYDEPLERYVAIKILSKRLSSSPEFVERFHREAKVLAAINHPGIAYIYSFGEEEAEHYFAMQWCAGGSLADLIKKKQALDLLPAVDIVLQCAQALHAAHRKGIVHRDIKPSNLLFDENQQIKIVDFGLAMVANLSSRVTHVNGFLGTPGFMAPEQAQSSTVDHRADIYSLGITFYYMIYGRHPFEASSAIEMLIKHASQPLPPFDDLKGRLPRALYDIITRMTQKNVAARYPDYGPLIEDLQQLRNDLLRKSQWRIPHAESFLPIPAIQSSNLFDLLSLLHTENKTGVLTVAWPPIKKTFFIRNREVVLFQSTQPDEDIWKALVQKKILTVDDLPPEANQTEKCLNRFLLNQKFGLEDFKTTYRQMMKAALLQVFFWPVLEGEFQEAIIQHDAFARIRIADLLLEGARGLVPFETIRDLIPCDALFYRTSQFEQLLSFLDLNPEESFIVSRLDQGIDLHTLQILSGLSEEKLLRFLFAMLRIGALQTRQPQAVRKPPPRARERKPDTASPPPATPPPATPPPPQPAPSAAPDHQEAAEPDSVVRMELQKTQGKIEAEHQVKVAEQFYRLAQEKMIEMDYWKVTQLCKEAIKHNPGEAKYYHLMASAYAQHPRFGKDAEQCFYHAIELDPWNPDYHCDLAYFYVMQGMTRRALGQVEKALEIAPQHEKAKEMLSDLKNRR